MAHDHSTATPDTYFQSFRSERDKGIILIPVVQHPTLGELYVIWTDITDCFPGATRIQFNNVFVPMLRDKRCYRVKPHGIRYHPGIVLDVVYGEYCSSGIRRVKHIGNSGTRAANIKTVQDATIVADAGATKPSARQELERRPTPVVPKDGPVEATLVCNRTRPALSQDSSVAGSPVAQQSSSQTPKFSKALSEGEDEDENVDRDEGDGRQEEDENQQDHNGGQGSHDDQTKVEEATVAPKEPASRNVTEAAEPKQIVKGSTPAQDTAQPPAANNMRTEEEKPDNTDDDERPSYTKELGDPATRELISNTIAECRPALTAMAEANQKLRPWTRPPDAPIDIVDLVAHRMKDILRSRQSWTQSNHSRFFCFLPILDYSLKDMYDSEIQANTRFEFYYICDCGGVPGFEGRWYPHWNLDYGEHYHRRTSSETISQQQIDEVIPLVGEYVVGILEMMLVGVHTDGVIEFPANTSQESHIRILLALRYFESKGVFSCQSYGSNKMRDPNNNGLSLDDIKPLATLDEKTSNILTHKVIKHRWEVYDELIPYRTSEGDVRWICQPHWYDMAPKREWMVARTFSVNPASTKSEYLTTQGAFVAEITNRQRMVDYFLLAGRLTKTCILRVSLNWDMTTEDEIIVAEAIGTLSAAAIHITVRQSSGVKSGSGLIGGCFRITMAAMRNPNLEAFKMIQRSPTKEKDYPVFNERRNIITSHLSMEALAVWTRPERRGKVKATLTVTDIDRAAKSVRLFAKGLHHFSELSLSIEPVWKTVTIKFAAPGSGKPGCDVEDTDFKNNDILSYLEKREFCDEIIYNGVGAVDSRFLYSRCVTEARLEFSLTLDRIKLRDVIKLNRNLKELTLENSTKDDPSQIFEAYKALMANHPSLKSFEICHRHLSRTSSNFSWSNPNDPAKMRLRISCFEGDKVQSLFQKYALIIESLSVDQLQAGEAAALEKAIRPKKGTAALRTINISDPHLMDPSVLDDLKKIILRTNVEDVAVYGSIKRTRTLPDYETEQLQQEQDNHSQSVAFGKDNNKPRVIKDADGNDMVIDEDDHETENANIWADFLVGIRSKVSRLSVRSNGSIFRALESRMVDSLEMPRLTDLSLLGEWELSLFGYQWIEKLMQLKKTRKETIESFHVSGATILPEEWDCLLQVLDFSQMTKFQIEQHNPLPPALLGPITDAIPGGKSPMEIFMVCDDRTLDGYAVLEHEEKVRAKISERNIVVIINGYTIS
ncbi:hypothetical protein BG015_000774 [Linnemannia schmuckeri]|uniref:Uncharacterized protein n=1 Tax=Linnemannia schmuckeri TaxID=64567 RepID=A0A9P5VDM1_9FUNG|nr:hypothetical protein BG015_000774 [Linnemannia schmuckeri]